MNKKESLCFYDTINIFIIPSVLLNLLMRKKIIYFRFIPDQYFAYFIKQFLKKFNIKKKDHLGKNPKDFISTFDKKYHLVNSYFANNDYINNFINIQSRKFKLDSIGLKKIETLVKNQLYKNNIDQDYSSINIINNLSYDYDLKYYPSNLNTYLLLKNELFKVSLSLILCNYLKIIFNLFKKINFKFNLFKKKTYHKKFDILDTKIGFCPHKSFKYMNAYKKNYIFNLDNTDYFKKELVINIFFEKPDTKTQRYLRINNLNYYHHHYSISDIFKVLFKNIFYFTNIIFSNLKSPIISLFLFFISFRIMLDHFVVKKRIKINKIFFHYDILVSHFFLFSCHLNYIKTFSVQDRFMQYLYFKFYFFDNYFVVNSHFKEELLNSGYVVTNFIENGLPRANYAQYLLKKYKFLNLHNLNNYNTNFTFLGLINNNDNKVGLFGEDGTSTKSNIDFLNIILELSSLYPNYGFHIAYKNLEFITKKPFKDIFNMLEKKQNIFFHIAPNKLNTYVLCYKSDLIIAKYTSIIDEMLSIGKRVLIYDPEHYISNFNYYLSKKLININSKEKLFEHVSNYKKLDFNEYSKFYNTKYNYTEYYKLLKIYVKNA